jgi:hypothetical protein
MKMNGFDVGLSANGKAQYIRQLLIISKIFYGIFPGQNNQGDKDLTYVFGDYFLYVVILEIKEVAQIFGLLFPS